MLKENKKNIKQRYHKAGFSLVELIVAVSIMLTITSVVIFKQSKFSSDVLITNLAYEIMLAIREAQVFGISSKAGPVVAGTPNYKVGYGIYLSGASDGVKPTQYIEFIDGATGTVEPGADTLPFNFQYDPGLDTIVGDAPVEIGRGQRIRSFCADLPGAQVGDPSTCWTSGGSDDFAISIVFVKPDPNAHITDAAGQEYGSVDIEVESALGDKCRTITVTSSGQISIQSIDTTQPSCSD